MRRKLTIEEQLKGVRAAILSKRTPRQLKPGLQKRKEALQEALRSRTKSNRPVRRSIFDVF